MHRAYLMRRQRFAEQVYRAHLSAKHTLLVQFGRRADVTLVKRLENRIVSFRASDARRIVDSTLILSINIRPTLTSFVETCHVISVLDAN